MAGTLCAIGLVLTDDLDYQDVLANMLDENSLLYFEAVKGTTLQVAQCDIDSLGCTRALRAFPIVFCNLALGAL